MTAEPRKYLVHVCLATATPERTAEAGAAGFAILKDISKGKMTLAYRYRGQLPLVRERPEARHADGIQPPRASQSATETIQFGAGAENHVGPS